MTSIVGKVDISRLKRKAKAAVKSQSLSYTQALNVVAQQFGCQDYRHALTLSREAKRVVPMALHETVFTATWSDGASSGIETFRALLPKPWREVLSLSERRMTRHLCFFRIAGKSRLVANDGYKTQSAARERIVSAVRELTFACVTGLRPARTRNWSPAYPQAQLDGNRTSAIHIPAADHTSVWCDPAGVAAIVDEPYPSMREDIFEKRQQWCDNYGYEWLAPKWTGIHAPHLGAQMLVYVRKENVALLRTLQSVLASLPPPVQAEPWEGESAIYNAPFWGTSQTRLITKP